MPRTALFELTGTIITEPMLFKRQPAALKPPSPSVAAVEAPRKRGFCFLGVVTPLLCAGRHIRNTRCRLLKRY